MILICVCMCVCVCVCVLEVLFFYNSQAPGTPPEAVPESLDAWNL